MKNDEFGDRMKGYEATTDVRLPADLPVVARLDGRSFSKFTRDFTRPFDFNMTDTMIAVTEYLVGETHAKIGYTQSDEITLIYEATGKAELFFGGRVLKLASVLASMAATKFALTCPYRARVEQRMPAFDCRVFSVPTRTEACNALLWRAQDARKNAVQSIARAHFSHKALHRKSQRDMEQMLAEIHVDIGDYPTEAVFGSYHQRTTRKRTLTLEEWQAIPAAHQPDRDELVERSSVEPLPILYLGHVLNREDAVFEGAQPVIGGVPR